MEGASTDAAGGSAAGAAAGAAGGKAAARPKPGSSEAIVTFTTKLPDPYQVPEEQLVVPASLARYGLSEVVNRLLGLEKPVPFDFLVGGEFLRSSISAYLEARKLTSEKVLQLEYVLALSEPEQTQVDEVPDWITGVVALQALPSRWFAAVSWDGTARIYDGLQARHVVRLADAGQTSAAVLPVDGGKGSHLIAGGKDGLARCCALRLGDGGGEGGSSATSGPTAALRVPGCQKAVQAVAINEDGTLLSSAGWDLDIHMWNASPELFAAPGDAGAGPKKRPAAGGEGAAPKFTLKGHSQVVTSLQFGAQARYPFTLLSTSWDCSVRVWDTAAASCVCNWTVARAATSLSPCPAAPPQIATSHEDGHVSIWDIRAPPHATVQGAVSLDATAGLPLAAAQSPHRRLVSQVAWCPLDATRMASVGHDGLLCILDPRSPKMPLQQTRIGKPGFNPTKLLCTAWLARDRLAVGGSDGKVVSISVEQSKLPSGEEA